MMDSPTPQEYARLLVEPAYDANKYTRGRLLVIAGSAQYGGAAVLAAHAAARSGAGYVTLATTHTVAAISQAHLLTVPVLGFDEDREGCIAYEAYETLCARLDHVDAVLIGSGLGRSDSVAHLVRDLVQKSPVPMVLDADGLNAFCGHTDDFAQAVAPLILAPHAGELQRLGTLEQLVSLCRVVVAKGPTTTISEGSRMVRDDTGPSALATAGTGDVLAGIIGALLCQGLEPFDAAMLGVHIHSTAALLACETLTSYCMMATDVIEYLPRALQKIRGVG